jgi:hypothetical protein
VDSVWFGLVALVGGVAAILVVTWLIGVYETRRIARLEAERGSRG